MIVSWNWLKDYIQVDVDIREYCDKMIMSGSNLETCLPFAKQMDKVIVGKILSIEKHPDADKLVICKIDLGKEEPVQIVTGATNVFEGAIVPVATDGSTIPGPLHGQPKGEAIKIKKGKLRGVVSEGMLCGCSELGFDEKVAPFESKDGIWILPCDNSKVGMELPKALELDDYVIDFEITPNRPDCLSMLGMAQETKATLGGQLTLPQLKNGEGTGDLEDFINVEVKTPLCKRYTARIIENVKIGQSPWWLQKKLMAAGMRPINNIVDITNFVMLEYGQPLHAFDITQLKDRKIIVDTAADGETFITLDGKERKLDSSMVMIRDGQRSVAVGGVMGGLNSEITDATETVVLESANFQGDSIRKTSKALGLRTESSSRYEKGIDPNLCKAASDRFCYLVELLGAGTVRDGIIDCYQEEVYPPVIDVRVSRINHVLGTEILREEMEKILTSLNCKVEGSGDIMIVTPPTVRQDLLKEVDFIEEVARIYGYDNLPMTLPRGNGIATNTKSWTLRNLAKDCLCAMGANEIQTFSFVSPTQMEKLGMKREECNFVQLLNPLGEDTSVMRTTLLPSLLEVLGRNYAKRAPHVRCYEIGTIFKKKDTVLPDESWQLCCGLYGGGDDFFTMKGMIYTLMEQLGVKNVKLQQVSNVAYLHPGRGANIVAAIDGNELVLGEIGEIHPDIAENYGIDANVIVALVDMDKVTTISDKTISYKQPPKYPSMERDIALVVDEDCQVGTLEEIITQVDRSLLKSVKLFDIYRGEQVDSGKKSVAFNLTYRHDDRTLTDKETDEIHQKVVDALREKAGATIRE